MVTLEICGKDECTSHTFIVLTGSWNPWGESQLRCPVTLLCTQCGKQLFTATWTGEEDSEEFNIYG